MAIRLTGQIIFNTWGVRQDAIVIIRKNADGNELVLEFTEPNTGTYTAIFRNDFENQYFGTFMLNGLQVADGNAGCRLYSYINLFSIVGEWVENGTDYFWFAEMRLVEEVEE